MQYTKESRGFAALVSWAKEMTSKVGRPELFIKRMLEAQHYHHSHFVESCEGKSKAVLRLDDHYFVGHSIVEQIVPAWMEGGPDLHEKLAQGLLGVLRYSGLEGLLNYVTAVIVGFGAYSEDAQWTLQTLESYSQLLDILKGMVAAAESFEDADAGTKALKAA